MPRDTHAFGSTKKSIASIGMCLIFLAPTALAADLTSSSFIVRDPMIGTGGGFGSSGTFKMFSSGNTNVSGFSTSTSYQGKAGFQYFPEVNGGTLSETTLGTSVQLDWTATTAAQGHVVTSYNVGIASVSGGPYTYTSLGNVLTYTYTGLMPGTYYFVVQTVDGVGDVIAQSNEVSATIVETVTFSISANSISFGALSSSGARYASTTGGSSTNTVAHTITAGTNASSGYSLSYSAPSALLKGSDEIDGATIAGDADGTPGTEQFALSLSTNGGAAITSAYQQASLNWSFTSPSRTTLASTSAPSATEDFSNHYIANTAVVTPAGDYSTAVTYVVTANF